MTKIPYVNMGVKSSVKTSTMQPPSSKLSKVHLNIFNIKSKKLSDFLCIFWNFLCILNVLCGDSKQCRKTLKMHKCHYYTIFPDIFFPIKFGRKI